MRLQHFHLQKNNISFVVNNYSKKKKKKKKRCCWKTQKPSHKRRTSFASFLKATMSDGCSICAFIFFNATGLPMHRCRRRRETNHNMFIQKTPNMNKLPLYVDLYTVPYAPLPNLSVSYKPQRAVIRRRNKKPKTKSVSYDKFVDIKLPRIAEYENTS
jgi:hypothetical protein